MCFVEELLKKPIAQKLNYLNDLQFRLQGYRCYIIKIKNKAMIKNCKTKIKCLPTLNSHVYACQMFPWSSCSMSRSDKAACGRSSLHVHGWTLHSDWTPSELPVISSCGVPHSALSLLNWAVDSLYCEPMINLIKSLYHNSFKLSWSHGSQKQTIPT